MNGRATITEFELLTTALINVGEQGILSLLKEKGAPIRGTLWLERDGTYEWTDSQSPGSLTRIVTWTKILPAKSENEK